jgi:hypothetical protein
MARPSVDELVDGGYATTSSVLTTDYGDRGSSPATTFDFDPAANVPTNPGPTIDTTTLAGIISASSGSSKTPYDPIASYTQPTSVPSPTVVQPIYPDDPRNTTAFAEIFMAAHNGTLPTSADFAAWRQSLIPPMPTDAGAHQHYKYYPQTGWKLYWDIGYGPGGWGSSLQTLNTNSSISTATFSSSSLGAVIDYSSINSNPIIDVPSLDVTIPPANGGAGSVETSSTIFTDTQSVPQPSPAIPAPTYALDTPENLYIDPSSFIAVPITETVIINGSATIISSTVYTTSVKFDSVDGAVSYNFRISATV